MIPKSVTWPRLRARCPSTTSVRQASTNSPAASRRAPVGGAVDEQQQREERHDQQPAHRQGVREVDDRHGGRARGGEWSRGTCKRSRWSVAGAAACTGSASRNGMSSAGRGPRGLQPEARDDAVEQCTASPAAARPAPTPRPARAVGRPAGRSGGGQCGVVAASRRRPRNEQPQRAGLEEGRLGVRPVGRSSHRRTATSRNPGGDLGGSRRSARASPARTPRAERVRRRASERSASAGHGEQRHLLGQRAVRARTVGCAAAPGRSAPGR
jgi:hypothetical protein